MSHIHVMPIILQAVIKHVYLHIWCCLVISVCHNRKPGPVVLGSLWVTREGTELNFQSRLISDILYCRICALVLGVSSTRSVMADEFLLRHHVKLFDCSVLVVTFLRARMLIFNAFQCWCQQASTLLSTVLLTIATKCFMLLQHFDKVPTPLARIAIRGRNVCFLFNMLFLVFKINCYDSTVKIITFAALQLTVRLCWLMGIIFCSKIWYFKAVTLRCCSFCVEYVAYDVGLNTHTIGPSSKL